MITPDTQLNNARTADEVTRALHRGYNVKYRDTEPEDPDLLTPEVLADWMQRCPESVKEDSFNQFGEMLRCGNLRGGNGEWCMDRVQEEWVAIPDDQQPPHMFLPVVTHWEKHGAYATACLKRAATDPVGFYQAVGFDRILQELTPYKAALLHDDPADMTSLLEDVETLPDEIEPAQPIYHLGTSRGRLEVAKHCSSINDADRLDAAHYWLPDNEASQSVVAMRARDNALTLRLLIPLIKDLRVAAVGKDLETTIMQLGLNFVAAGSHIRNNGKRLLYRLSLLFEFPTAPPLSEGGSLLARLVTDLWPVTEPPRDLSFAKATVTGGNKSGMTRRVQIVSTMRRVGWTPEEGRPGAVVDGEPMAAALPDPANQFPIRQRRPRRKYRPGEQRELAFPPSPSIPQDMRLLALQEVSADRTRSYVLPGDVLVLLTLAHLADYPFELTEHQGAALIVRDLDGKTRAVQPQYDYPRFWKSAYELRALVLWEPNGGYRWAEMATVEVPKVSPVDRIVLGPPTWARGAHVGKWTLTAEGSAASLMRVTAGKQSLAGRIVTGLEYRLAAGWNGKPNTIAPNLLPQHQRRRGGPGVPVFVRWRDCLFGAGDWWDVTDRAADRAALSRFDRAVESLKQRGYFVGEDLRSETVAGDSVEIICRQRGSRSRPSGLMVRASARFVEAARLAQLPRGTGFDPMSLAEYTGIEDR